MWLICHLKAMMYKHLRGRRGHDLLIARLTTTYAISTFYLTYIFVCVCVTTNVLSSNPAHNDMYSMQHYVI
jgi:hypothetical protein